jgi:putative sigma-54 modulation protein
MRVEFLCKNYNASDKLKDVIRRKIDKLDKFFENETTVKVVLKETKDIETMEVTVGLTGCFIRGEVSSDNMYDNIDLVIPKLEKQIIKHHSKIKSKKGNIKDLDVLAVEEAKIIPKKKVVRERSFDLVPMTVDDAIEELELLGHDFYVFLNKATGNVCVLYLRNDKDYGLIETRQ